MSNDDLSLKFINACRYGNAPEIKNLLSSGVDVNCWNGWALSEAVSNNQQESVRLLLDHNVSVLLYGDAAVEAAHSKGFSEIYSLLCGAGATPVVNIFDADHEDLEESEFRLFL